MRKFLDFAMAAGVIVAVAGVSQAQTGQGCGGTVQSYQRYSYQPVPSSAPSSAPSYAPSSALGQGGVVNGPVMASPAVVNTLPQVSNPQAYRRYSYVPQSYYGHASAHKNLWEYAKGDPRRYRP